MEKKKWDEIPSLEGLEVDWGFRPETKEGKRAHSRLKHGDLTGLINSGIIPVKVATREQVLNGTLFDLCEGGMAVELKQPLAEQQAVRVGFFLGAEKIITTAQVRHVRRTEALYRVGLQFIGLDQSARKYIVELYASRVLKHAL